MARSSTVVVVLTVCADISKRYIEVQHTRTRRGPHTTAPPARHAAGERFGPHRAADTLRAVRRHTDYALARRAVLRDLQRGAVTRLDVCDAHPELLRAGRNLGEAAPYECPVCGEGNVRFVSYVYGDKLGAANGRCI